MLVERQYCAHNKKPVAFAGKWAAGKARHLRAAVESGIIVLVGGCSDLMLSEDILPDLVERWSVAHNKKSVAFVAGKWAAGKARRLRAAVERGIIVLVGGCSDLMLSEDILPDLVERYSVAHNKKPVAFVAGKLAAVVGYMSAADWSRRFQ